MVLQFLAEKAYWREFYREIGKIRGYPLPSDEKADVRKEIERYSQIQKFGKKPRISARTCFTFLVGAAGPGCFDVGQRTPAECQYCYF
jgi:hypothetical protein